MFSTKEFIDRLFGRAGNRPAPLPRQTVEHDGVDKYRFQSYTDDSPRFRRIAVEDAPQIAPEIVDPEAPDFTTADPKDIKAWQEEVRANEEKRANAPEYDAWADLTRDVFYGYHHPSEPEVLSTDEVDPAVAAHAKINAKMVADKDHQDARNLTRDNANASALATMASVRTLRDALETALIEQARQSEEFERARDEAEGAMSELDSAREEARAQHQANGQVDPALAQQIRELVQTKRAAQQQAAEIAQQSPKAFDQAAHDACTAAAKAGKEAAENGASLPSFGSDGFGRDEPRYDSPEQALTIADMWANNPTLRAVAELYGRLDKHMRFQRAKRTVGGADEIVDLKFGDDLRRVLPTELAFLADEEFEDDFYARYLSSELVVYDTVGDENAGRGPIVLVGDESGSMNGERNIWMKAVACCLLNIARREKRDFCYVGFATVNEAYSIQFPAKKQLQANDIIEMASHFFNGSGTVPLAGTTLAKKVMDNVTEFKKADIVIVGDGDGTFTNEDKRLRDSMESRGVRFHGIGIGGSRMTYLVEYCGEDMVVHIHDFDLSDPSEATAQLATHIQ
jgi:uncharacterized protein with von Willebrand factor type A (vWA) domain